MRASHDGFLYPTINEETCISCGKCVEICPSMGTEKRCARSQNQEVFLATPVSAEEMSKSSSAGAAYALGCQMLEKGGAVFGAIYNKNPAGLVVRHDAATEQGALGKQQGSKYVQSAINDTYRKIKDFLNSDTGVLFTGTPCQVDALYHFLGNEYKNLITCDLLCAGVPPQSLFDRYISYLEEKTKSEVVGINFRSKRYGYGFGNLTAIEFSNKKPAYVSCGPEAGFSRCMELGVKRPSCFTCKYASLDRVGDISLGDFHNVDCAGTDFEKGASLVLINSVKGQEIFQAAEKNFKIEKRTTGDALKSNRYALSPYRQEPPHYQEMLKGVSQFSWLEYYKHFLSYAGTKEIVMRLLPPRTVALLRRVRRNMRQLKQARH